MSEQMSEQKVRLLIGFRWLGLKQWGIALLRNDSGKLEQTCECGQHKAGWNPETDREYCDLAYWQRFGTAMEKLAIENMKSLVAAEQRVNVFEGWKEGALIGTEAARKEIKFLKQVAGDAEQRAETAERERDYYKEGRDTRREMYAYRMRELIALKAENQRLRDALEQIQEMAGSHTRPKPPIQEHPAGFGRIYDVARAALQGGGQ